MGRFRKGLLTGDETTAVGGEIRHEGSYFLWSPDAWNWRGQIGLQQVLYQVQSFVEIETVPTTPPLPSGFAPFLEPVMAPNSSTGGDGLTLAESAADVEEGTYSCEYL